MGESASIATVAESGDRYLYRTDDNGCAVIVRCESSATEIVVPRQLDGRDVVGIEREGFARIFTLKRVVLPEGLESIGDRAFRSCVALGSVHLPETLKTVGSEAFRATALAHLDIPAACATVQDDSFSLYESWTAPPSTIRPSTLESVQVASDNPVLKVEGGVLCRRCPDGLRAVLCPANSGDVSLTAPIASVLPSAFTGVKRLATLRVHERLLACKRGVVFPQTACETLVLELSRGNEVVLRMPDDAVAMKTLSKLFRGVRVDVGQAVGVFDGEVAVFPDKVLASRAMLERLVDGAFLSDATRTAFERRIRAALKAICMHFATTSYWEGFDRLFDLAFVDEGNVTAMVDVLSRYGETAAVGYLLQERRNRFGKAVWDYDL